MLNNVRDVCQGKRASRGTPFARARFLTARALRERGWTDALIDDLLGPPHETRPNPYYVNGGEMKLWRKIDVIAAEDDAQFVNRPRGRDARAADWACKATIERLEALDIVCKPQVLRPLEEIEAEERWEAWLAREEEPNPGRKPRRRERRFFHLQRLLESMGAGSKRHRGFLAEKRLLKTSGADYMQTWAAGRVAKTYRRAWHHK